MSYPGMLAETVKFRGHNGDTGEAYYARPTGAGKFPGVVLIHHMPGWDEWITEATRKLAHHGFATIAPHLYFREGPGQPGRRRRPRSRRRRRGRRPGGRRRRGRRGLSAGAAPRQRQGRRDRLLLRRPPRLPGRLPRRRTSSTRWSIAGAATSSSTIPRRSTPSARSRRSISPTTSNVPILGIFGNDDENPNKDQVNRTEAVLKKLGKNYTLPPLRRRRPRLLQHLARRLPRRTGRRRLGQGVRLLPQASRQRPDQENIHVLLHR